MTLIRQDVFVSVIVPKFTLLQNVPNGIVDGSKCKHHNGRANILERML